MNKSYVDIKSGCLFPIQFQFFGVLLIIITIVLFVTYPLWSILTLLLSLLIFTSTSGIEFNPTNKTYRPYHSFLFIKTGKALPYDEIEKIYINGSHVTQRIYTAHTAQSATFKNKEFDAYVKFTNGKKEYLLTDKKKELLIEKLRALSASLNIEITDNTDT